MSLNPESVDRANRVSDLMNHPGFIYLRKIIDELLQEVRDAADDFKGWDKDQISTLHERCGVAKELKEEIFKRLENLVLEGKQVDVHNRQQAEYVDGRPLGTY